MRTCMQQMADRYLLSACYEPHSLWFRLVHKKLSPEASFMVKAQKINRWR